MVLQKDNMKQKLTCRSSFLILLLFISCSFDYGDQEKADKDQPDIVMENVEYVRIRSADPQARFQAELVERYEERRIMELRNFSFEQFGNHGQEINAYGRAGSASVEIDSGDIRMDDGVRIDVESEDLAIETIWLEWKDNERTLSSGEENEVSIFQEEGTAFTGLGFHADARRRTWEFNSSVSGFYFQDDDEEDEVADLSSTEEISEETADDESEAVSSIENGDDTASSDETSSSNEAVSSYEDDAGINGA